MAPDVVFAKPQRVSNGELDLHLGLDLHIWGAPFLPNYSSNPFKTSVFSQIWGTKNGAPQFCRSNPPPPPDPSPHLKFSGNRRFACVLPFTKTMEITKTTKTTKTTQTTTNKELSAVLTKITETAEMTKTTGIQGANHGWV